jgi:3-oxocholest-4-en-26-oate---CoA ligase
VAPAATGPAPTLAGLQDHCRGQLAGYKLPRGLQLVEAVARTPAGKPDYPRLREALHLDEE